MDPSADLPPGCWCTWSPVAQAELDARFHVRAANPAWLGLFSGHGPGTAYEATGVPADLAEELVLIAALQRGERDGYRVRRRLRTAHGGGFLGELALARVASAPERLLVAVWPESLGGADGRNGSATTADADAEACALVARVLGHDLRQDMRMAASWIELAQRETPHPRQAQALEQLSRVQARLAEMTSLLRAGLGSGNGTSDLGLAVAAAPITDRASLDRIDLPTGALVAMSASELAELFARLLARTAPGGPATGLSAGRDGGCWWVVIDGTDPAVPADERESAIRPFVAGGCLAWCRRLLRRRGGDLALAAAESGRHRVVLRLPAVEP